MTDRERAIRHVAGLVGAYRARLGWRLPETARRFCESRASALTRELGTLRTTGPEAQVATRFWVGIGGAE